MSEGLGFTPPTVEQLVEMIVELRLQNEEVRLKASEYQRQEEDLQQENEASTIEEVCLYFIA